MALNKCRHYCEKRKTICPTTYNMIDDSIKMMQIINANDSTIDFSVKCNNFSGTNFVYTVLKGPIFSKVATLFLHLYGIICLSRHQHFSHLEIKGKSISRTFPKVKYSAVCANFQWVQNFFLSMVNIFFQFIDKFLKSEEMK